MTAIYRLRFFFDWGCNTCFWADNLESRLKYGIGPISPKQLGLSEDTAVQINKLAELHDKSINRDYPIDPGPWREVECNRFNQTIRDLYKKLVDELGSEYELINIQPIIHEDPELDIYIADPKAYRRNKGN